MSDAVIDRARVWLSEDPDEGMRAELTALIAAAEGGDLPTQEELADAFAGTLQFGTAGLRGPVGPGPNRMNQVVVARAAAGLAEYLREHGGGSVVIGHDARHGSALFARVSAEILSGAGLDVLVLPPQLPTPTLAFAVRHLGCAAGVMVTASHNPQRDNGYKVYLADGIQIVPPADAEIAEHIARVTLRGPVDSLPRGSTWTALGDDIQQAYIARAASLIEAPPPSGMRVAYTPVHGVGGATFLACMEAAGFAAPLVVASQFQPDPDFGGMPFPNPEEPGVMDAVIELARASGCDLALANDPDADRFAVGIPDVDGWRMLSGDEVGWLLGWWISSGNRRREGRHVLAQSIVSGSMLEAIAEDAGVPYAQTLTGFKWIARVPDLAFGYEEALGYCVDPAAVSDKDGITAGLLFAEMTAQLAQRGATIPQILDDLALRHGVYATGQVSVRHADASRIAQVMSALRDNPPATLGGLAVERVDDLEQPTDGLPPTDGLRYALAGHGRVIVRPSGTEAKVKSYLQARVPVEGGDLAAARARAQGYLQALQQDLRSLLG